jgi:hypothetical protein
VTPDAPARDGPDGIDGLDVAVNDPPPPVEPAGNRWLVPTRLAPGLSAMPAPPAAFLIVGLLAGPEGLGLLSPSMLATLDPVVSVALAAIGALVGMSITVNRVPVRVFAAAGLQAVVPFVLIAGSMLMLSHGVLPFAGSAVVFAAMLGIVGVSASTPRPRADTDSEREAEQAGALREVVPIVIGGAALAWFSAPSVVSATSLLLLVFGVSGATALLGWLLVSDAFSDAERSVFAIGVLLLLGGAAALLSASALLAGFVAGGLLRASKSDGSDRLMHDIRYMQHPLIVLLLVTAGARVSGASSLWIPIGLFVAARTAAAVVAGSLTARLLKFPPPYRFDRRVLSSGLTGIACAFNLLQARPVWDVAEVLIAVVVSGAIVSDLLAVMPREERR